MVGIVPRSAKLMELAGLFSGKARSLLSRGIGSLTVQGGLVVPCRGNVYPSQVLDLRSPAPRAGVVGVCVSRDPVPCGISPALEFQEIQQSTTSGLEVKQTFGYLKIMGQFEELRLRALDQR